MKLPLLRCLSADLARYRTKGVAGVLFNIFFCYEFQIVILYRLSHQLHLCGFTRVARVLRFIQNLLYHSDIHFESQIGPGLRIKHGMGIVIGNKVVIGNHATLFNGVTFGTRGILEETYPVAGNSVFVGTGAKVLGAIRLGDHAVVGANSVVITSVPDNTIVAGIPARTVRTHELDMSSL